MRITKFLLAATALMLVASPGQAADMDEPILVEAQDEYQPVEVGSGWYLRGDLGYSFSNEFERTERIGAFGSDVSPIVASVGMGYHFNDFIRGELNIGILPTEEFKRNDSMTTCPGYEDVVVFDQFGNSYTVSQNTSRPCTQSTSAETAAYDLMASAYVDLGTYSGFTPYLGAGLGVMYVDSKYSTGDKNCISDQVFYCSSDSSLYEGQTESLSDLNFAYSLAAGLSYRIADSASIDVGYEYKSAPGAKYYSIENDGLVTKEGLDFHAVKVGFRYDLW